MNDTILVLLLAGAVLCLGAAGLAGVAVWRGDAGPGEHPVADAAATLVVIGAGSLTYILVRNRDLFTVLLSEPAANSMCIGCGRTRRAAYQFCTACGHEEPEPRRAGSRPMEP